MIRRQGSEARVEDIVQEAGASKGTFYVYFETWETFLLELRDGVYRDLEARFEQYRGECVDWVELIGGLPGLFIDLTQSLEGLHEAVLHGVVEHTGVRNPRHDVKSKLADMIAEGMAQKALQAPDVAATTQFVYALLHEAAELVAAGENGERVARTLEQLLLNALKVKRVRLKRRAP